MDAGGVLECPFTNYVSFGASAADIKGATQQFSIATQSLDAVISTFRDNAKVNIQTKSSSVYNSLNFHRGSAAFNNVTIRVNNVPFPSYGPCDVTRCAASVIHELVGSQDTLGSCTNSLVSLDKFADGHYAHALRLNHMDSAYGNRLICGMNTLNNPAVVSITYDGTTGTTIQPQAWAVCTATLSIGKYRQVEARF